jgi:UDP-glucose 4-epimerase
MGSLTYDNFFANKNVLVTGGAGYIGSNLVKFLLSLDACVTSLDNYISGSSNNHHSGCEYIEGSVANIFDFLDPSKFEIIFHLGEYSRVEQSLTSPFLALNNIYSPIAPLIEFWRLSGAKLIYSGSSTKFADDGNGKGLSPYTFAKASNSDLVRHFARWYNLDYAIVYFYNVYGGNEIEEGDFATLIGRYKSRVKMGYTELPVTKPGTQKRNFTHINDIISGIALSTVYGAGDSYGIGADQAYSVLDVCRLFKCSPVFRDANVANRMSGPVLTDKIKELGWSQGHVLADEVEDFLDENCFE